MKSISGHRSFDIYLSIDADCPEHKGDIRDPDIYITWEIDRATTAIRRIRECAAIATDVVVVPIFWQSQLGKGFITLWKGSKDLSAVKTGVGSSELVDRNEAKAQCNQHGGGGLQICGPVLHRAEELSKITMA